MSVASDLDFHDRHYDPEVGRFIQTDQHPGNLNNPLTFINKYIYVLNNPINAIDPMGLWSLKRAFKSVVNTVKKVMSNKVAGLIISTVVAGPLGTLAYINMSGQFHPNDVALVNMIAVTAVAVAVAGPVGAEIGFAAGGGMAGLAAGAVAGAVVGGIAGGFTGGTLSALNGSSFVDGFVSGAVTGMIAGALAGAYTGYTNPYYAEALASSEAYAGMGGMGTGTSAACSTASTALGVIGAGIFATNIGLSAAGILTFPYSLAWLPSSLAVNGAKIYGRSNCGYSGLDLLF